MSDPYAICATSTQGLLINNLYYYPAIQCLFQQPATLITNSPISQVGNCNDVAGSGSSCQSSSSMRSLTIAQVNTRPGAAALDFRYGNVNPLRNGLPRPLPDDAVPALTIPGGEDVGVLFARDYLIAATDAEGNTLQFGDGMIRVFYVAYYEADRLLGTPGPPRIQVRGIGQELPPKVGNPGRQRELQVVFLDDGGYYCDCNLVDAKSGQVLSTIPHDVFTVTRITR